MVYIHNNNTVYQHPAYRAYNHLNIFSNQSNKKYLLCPKQHQERLAVEFDPVTRTIDVFDGGVRTINGFSIKSNFINDKSCTIQEWKIGCCPDVILIII